ncbi:AbrB/MazE/SpoVT family DNA-binding domain-containing protein [Roseicella aquatilis]|uniref:AbrB/MazE/SpoVT family DNA-binding domain-containing protein n=1 Tax=Roseicella aquatilis TaxID=2527868 RepID=A0A4R4D6L6_9PROT|nr:AbrB/MazE/SpoVT family DNA-binding domain-containing protein [Roseicella aquatilis]TCZ55967.1 AbrB/MazE/SpoVT family DNA-binding domain-containing protein [Roseicella aquatilis]
MRITSKGQVTIPAHIRAQAGLLPQTEVEFAIEDGIVTLRPAGRRPCTSRGAEIARHLRGRFLRSGVVGMTTDEIMALTHGE